MTKPAMVKHELGCTLNPNRVCGLCALIDNVQEPIKELTTALLADTEKLTVLRKLVDDCPACILAALRQYNRGADMEDWLYPEFDFKAEMVEFWKEYNASNTPNYYG
jgi:hypothetical protein